MPASHASLLFVDDDPVALHAMRKVLAEYPNQRFATSGAEALRLVHEVRPDLILLDANMPGMTGLEVCDALQADPELRRIPVIMATAAGQVELELAALQRGAIDFVCKPLAPPELRSRVRAHLRSHEAIGKLQPEAWTLAEGGHAEPASAAAAAELPRLLVVDDDVAAIHLLRSTLAPVGSVHFATSGAAALQLAPALRPDLVLLDAHMPGLDGFAVCAELKKQPGMRNVPIVFVTRYADAARETRALDIGAADFISKPYAPAVLCARVRNLLALKRRIDRELRATSAQWRSLADARVADIVGSATDAILSCDGQLDVVLANAAAARLFERGVQDLVGQPLASLVGATAALLGATSQGPVRLELLRRSGPPVPVEVSVSHLGQAHQRLSTLVLRAVGDREKLESETRARLAAEASSQAKTRMMGWIAHEMGNPLNAMLGFATLMQMDTAAPLPPAQALRLAQVAKGARSLKQLLDDLLLMARADSEALPVTLQAIDLGAVCAAALQAVAAAAGEAKVTLHSGVPEAAPQAVADGQRLHQCLVNLLSNAVKYNRPGGAVTLALWTAGQQVHLAVRDNGIGMDARQMQALFEPFNRLGRQHGDVPGSGLGLVITRQLVLAMGGELRVEGQPGLGCCFTIVLPCAGAAAPG